MSVPRTANPNTQRCLQQARTSLAASMAARGLLSPARAMEWIYLDSLRLNMHL